MSHSSDFKAKEVKNLNETNNKEKVDYMKLVGRIKEVRLANLIFAMLIYVGILLLISGIGYFNLDIFSTSLNPFMLVMLGFTLLFFAFYLLATVKKYG